MITIGTTFWVCPNCKTETTIDGMELADIGDPYCECGEELEPLDDPMPTIIETKGEIGVILRPHDTDSRSFRRKIIKLRRDFPNNGKFFFDYLSEEHNIEFLKVEVI